jgi:hypothetical protein
MPVHSAACPFSSYINLEVKIGSNNSLLIDHEAPPAVLRMPCTCAHARLQAAVIDASLTILSG